MADHPNRRKPHRRRPEESTQPDMEVPAEMLEAGEQIGRPSAAMTTPGEGGRTLMTRSPAAGRRPVRRATPSPQAAGGMERGGASWTRQVVESGSLELELDQEFEPLGEGDGATRVISMSELGDLQNIRGMGPAQMGDLPPQARTETHVMAVSMEQLEDSFNEADISSGSNHNPYQYVNDALEHEVTIGPNSGIKPPQIDDYYSHSQEELDGPIDVLEESIDIVNIVDESGIVEEDDPGEVTSASVGQASRPMSIRRVRRTSTGSQPRSATPAPRSSSQSPPSASSPSHSSQEALSARSSQESLAEARGNNDAPRGKGKSLEALANAVKQKRTQQRSTRLGVSQRAEASEEKPVEDDSNQSHQERIRSIAQKARQRVEERERAESQQSLAAISGDELPAEAGARVARAQQLVAEARALMEEARELADGLDDVLSLQAGAAEIDAEIDEDAPPLDPSTRREARKILEMARRLAEVEQNRLPGSTRKTIMRLVKELDGQIEEHDGGNTARLALQLANRLFETIRRDLRPW